MTELYLTFKALHLLSIIAWAGSMLLLPWLYVLLVKHKANPDKELLLLEIIRLLIKRVVNGAMILAYLSGGGLYWVLSSSGGMPQGWLHAKITLALILSLCHGLLSRSLRRMVKRGDQPKSLQFYRLLGFISIFCVIGAVFLAVQKPF